jgi:hypothetical protein
MKEWSAPSEKALAELTRRLEQLDAAANQQYREIQTTRRELDAAIQKTKGYGQKRWPGHEKELLVAGELVELFGPKGLPGGLLRRLGRPGERPEPTTTCNG